MRAMGHIIAAAAILTLVTGAGAAATKPRASLFGISLGSPLSLPGCPLDTSFGVSSVARDRIPEMCWDDSRAVSIPADGSVEVYFASGNSPSFIQFGSITVATRAGNVDKINVFTRGVSSQDEVLSTLVQKYGKPAVLKSAAESNMMGAKFDVIHATWILGMGDKVQLMGALDKFTDGAIVAETLEAARDDAAQANAHAGPAL